MATITYKCNECKRTIDLIENQYGMTVFAKCVITNGCKGGLYTVKRNPDNIRESDPTFVDHVQNYIPRKLFFKYTQSLQSKKWKIVHGLGVEPAISVYTPDNVELNQDDYTVAVIDANTITISFLEKMTGVVHCVARSSVAAKVNSVPENQVLVQASNNSVFTFAIPKYLTRIEGSAYTPADALPVPDVEVISELPHEICDNDIRIEIEVTMPNREPIICFESLEDTINPRSPWYGWNQILIRKRRNHCVRTKKFIDFNAFNGGDYKIEIPEGTRLRFLRIDYGTGRIVNIESKHFFNLLTKKPFSSSDKSRDTLVDVGEILQFPLGYYVYHDGEFHIDSTLVERTYPIIEKVS